MIIYKVTNNINGKIYIGQTVRSLEERLAEHKRSKKGVLAKAFKKYGIENFEIEIVEKCSDKDILNEKEIYWIKHFNCINPNGYNLCEGGGQTNGYNHTDVSKIKMSKSKSKMYLGSDNPFFGKTHSDAQKDKWSKERSGRKLSKEWKENIGKSQWKKVINVDTGEVFNSIKEASLKYGIEPTHITRVCKGKRNRTGGFRWEYFE